MTNEDVLDLSYSENGLLTFGHSIQQGFLRWWHSVISAITAETLIVARRPVERSGDNPADPVGTVQDFSGYFTDFVLPLQVDGIYMAGNLKHAVTGSVDNRLACFLVLLAQLF